MNKKQAERNRIVADHTSAIVRSMLAVSDGLHAVVHNVSKGTLRELLVSTVLRRFLPSQLSVASGIVVNRDGRQSKQTDIIVFDNRVLPPFMYDQSIGAIPAEATVATIEVKSRLLSRELQQADQAAAVQRQIYGTLELGLPAPLKGILAPLAYVFAFHGRGPTNLHTLDRGRAWLSSHAQNLRGVALAREYSWMVVRGEWVEGFEPPGEEARHEKTKRFFALLVDNARYIAEMRYRYFTKQYRDWLGPYIRG